MAQNCPNCHRSGIPDTANNCSGCGTSLFTNCSNCSTTRISVTAHHCPNCGHKLSDKKWYHWFLTANHSVWFVLSAIAFGFILYNVYDIIFKN